MRRPFYKPPGIVELLGPFYNPPGILEGNAKMGNRAYPSTWYAGLPVRGCWVGGVRQWDPICNLLIRLLPLVAFRLILTIQVVTFSLHNKVFVRISRRDSLQQNCEHRNFLIALPGEPFTS